MEIRVFGRARMRLSVLGFGCGAVGGLMVRGDPLDQERTVAQAIDAGVNYFDTAVQYGNGGADGREGDKKCRTGQISRGAPAYQP
jgi:aryl-alcohol dehydrogenase-like predicted oxidoreductase